MANRPSRLVVSIPTASGDGKYYGRYPNGNAPVGSVALSGTPEDDSSASATLTTGSGLAITTGSPLPQATIGVAYSVTLTASGGTPPYTWALVSGTLPAGLGFSGATISGTPSATGSVSLTFQVTDSLGHTAEQALSLTVAAATLGLPVNLLLTSAVTSASAPWTFGHPFVQGNVPAGQYITATAGTTSFQADVRNRWPDGSVKFAVLSGVSSLTANAPKTITINTTGTAPSGATVAESVLSGISHTVAFTGAVTGAVALSSFVGVDRSTWSQGSGGRVRQILGQTMSEFHYYAPTSDAQVSVWFYVRAYANGAIEIETVIENGWLSSGTAAQKNYGVTITVNATSVYSVAALGMGVPWTGGSTNTSTALSIASTTFSGRDFTPYFPTGSTFFVNNAPSTVFTVTSSSYSGGSGVTTVNVSGGLPTVTSVNVVGHPSHSRWSRVDWYDATKGAPVTPQHRSAYFMASQLVPNMGYTSPDSSAYSNPSGGGVPFPSTLNPAPWTTQSPTLGGTPIQQSGGYWYNPMGDEGDYSASEIGPLSGWDALYCTAAAPQAYAASISMARGFGWHNVHYRDQSTGRPPLIASYPTLGMPSPPGVGAGGAGTFPVATGLQFGFDEEHHGSMIVPYLIEGRWSFLESLQFVATFCVLDELKAYRVDAGYNSLIVCHSVPVTTRGWAWIFRTVGQAAAVSPTGFSLNGSIQTADLAQQQQFATSISNTCTYLNGVYITGSIVPSWASGSPPTANVTELGIPSQTMPNTVGWIGQYDTYNGEGSIPNLTGNTGNWWGGMWMIQWQAGMLGLVSQLGLENLADSASLIALRNFVMQAVIGHLDVDANWNIRNLPYSTPFLQGNGTVYTPLAPPAAYPIWKSTLSISDLGTNNPGDFLCGNNGDGEMAGTDTSNDAFGYWAQAIMALAYCVDAKIPGAWDCYRWIRYASNFNPASHGASDAPKWAVVPRAVPTPTWLQGAAVNEWITLTGPNSTTPTLTPSPAPPGNSGTGSITDAWGGATLRKANSWFLLHGGGHNDYAGNEIDGLELLANTPTWTRIWGPTPNADIVTYETYYSDGNPACVHTYYYTQFDNRHDHLMRYKGGQFDYDGLENVCDGWNFIPTQWEAAGTYPAQQAASGTYLFGGGSSIDLFGQLCTTMEFDRWFWQPSTKTWTHWTTSNAVLDNAMAYDSKRNVHWSLGGPPILQINPIGQTDAVVTVTGANGSPGVGSGSAGAAYDPEADMLFVIDGSGNTYQLNPATLVASNVTTTGATLPVTMGASPGDGGNGTWGKVRYVDELGGIVYQPYWGSATYFMRTH